LLFCQKWPDDETRRGSISVIVALPFDELRIRGSRKLFFPPKSHRATAPKDPKTLGEKLRLKRCERKLNRTEAARLLKVSPNTLMAWESDAVYPSWPNQPRLIEYLGVDPFQNPASDVPQGNESSDVAILSPNRAPSLAMEIRKRRLELRLSLAACAKKLGAGVRTLRRWQAGKGRPNGKHRERLAEFLGRGPLAGPEAR